MSFFRLMSKCKRQWMNEMASALGNEELRNDEAITGGHSLGVGLAEKQNHKGPGPLNLPDTHPDDAQEQTPAETGGFRQRSSMPKQGRPRLPHFPFLH